MHDQAISISVAELTGLVACIFKASGVSEGNAAIVAKALVMAEIDGQFGHGLSRVSAYAAQARSGKVDGVAIPEIARRGASLLAVDARNGFAFPAIDAAIAALAEFVPDAGIGAALIRRSHHCGQLGAHVERLAQQGFVCLMMSNAPPAMAAWGGLRPVFGTNPIAFAAPRRRELPLVIDLSLSKVARGKVMAAAQAGKSIPEGWAIDRNGVPTTDPVAALRGSMLPAGGAKGTMLALIVEILCGTLAGANHSYEASSFFDAQGEPPGVGQVIIAFNRACVAGNSFADRLERLLAEIISDEGVRLPGAGRAERRAAAEQNGISVSPQLHEQLIALL